jgi:hypothetical protein
VASMLKMVLSLMSKVDYDDRSKDRTRRIKEEKIAPVRNRGSKESYGRIIIVC